MKRNYFYWMMAVSCMVLLASCSKSEEGITGPELETKAGIPVTLNITLNQTTNGLSSYLTGQVDKNPALYGVSSITLYLNDVMVAYDPNHTYYECASGVSLLFFNDYISETAPVRLMPNSWISSKGGINIAKTNNNYDVTVSVNLPIREPDPGTVGGGGGSECVDSMINCRRSPFIIPQ